MPAIAKETRSNNYVTNYIVYVYALPLGGGCSEAVGTLLAVALGLSASVVADDTATTAARIKAFSIILLLEGATGVSLL